LSGAVLGGSVNPRRLIGVKCVKGGVYKKIKKRSSVKLCVTGKNHKSKRSKIVNILYTRMKKRIVKTYSRKADRKKGGNGVKRRSKEEKSLLSILNSQVHQERFNDRQSLS